MAEALGVACGVAQFVGLAGQAAQGFQWMRQQLKGIKSAPKLIKKIHHELRILEYTVTQLRNIEQDCVSEDAAQSFIATLESCGEILDDLYRVLSKYDFEIDMRRIQKLWKQIVVNDKKGEIEEYLQRLERAKTSLISAMAGTNLQMSSDFRRCFTIHSQNNEQSLSRIETKLDHVETGLQHIETGVSSLLTISEQTYDKTVDIADVMRKIDHSIEDLRSDIPDLLERGLQQCLESRLEKWLEVTGTLGAGEMSQGHTRKSLTSSDSSSETLREVLSCPSCPTPSVSTTQQEPKLLHDRSTSVLQLAFTRKDPTGTYTRKKTYSRNVTLPFGFIQTKTTQKIHSQKTTDGYTVHNETIRVEIDIVPFQWLSSQGRLFTIEKISNAYKQPSWTYTPRLYNVIPEDSMIMVACKRQDLVAIRKLFEYRQASPFDVDSEGTSLMGKTIKCYDDLAEASTLTEAKEIIRYLLSQGADPTQFLDELLDRHLLYSRFRWFLEIETLSSDNDGRLQEAVDEIWRLCLERCQSDPFDKTTVLEKLWDASLGGKHFPPLDPAYLFIERYSGFDELAFGNSEKVFSDLLCPGRLSGGPDELWQCLIDQQYEVLVYLYTGGENSLKSRIFSENTAAKGQSDKNILLCPSSGSHLLLLLLHQSSGIICKTRSRKVRLQKHVYRMLVLLLQGGEIPDAACTCRARWQRYDKSCSATDVAAAGGMLAVWAGALEVCGFDSTRMIEDWRYDGVSSLFDEPTEDKTIQRKLLKNKISSRATCLNSITILSMIGIMFFIYIGASWDITLRVF